MTMSSRPNFLIIVADDLGFSDLGCFGSEIQTPNLDRLAEEGLRMSGFHTASACSPTRSMLLSGTDNHLAAPLGVGAMSEHVNRPGGSQWRGHPGYEGYLRECIASLPEILQEAGYHTMLSGKWHLGFGPEHGPHRHGFARSNTMLGGAHNHYGYEPQFDRKVTDKDLDLFQKFCTTIQDKKDLYMKEGRHYEFAANCPYSPDGYYSTEAFTEQLLSYLSEDEAKDKPWFAYLPFTAPHWPLQAPRGVREKYKGVYDEGPSTLRQKRLAKLEAKGIIPPGTAEKAHPFVNGWRAKEYDELSAEQKSSSNRTMETFAAMVDCIDTAVGRVVAFLRESGQLDNTFVLFMSDNGAEGGAYEAIPVMGPSIVKVIDEFYNNDLDNIGEPDSFVWYGHNWAQAATAPSRLMKHFTTEGGTRVPLILRFPPKVPASGKIVDTLTTVMDIMPTVLDLAGVEHPTRGSDKGSFKGREVIGIKGRSWIEFLESGKAVHATTEPMGWELHGKAALRIGDWKLNFVPPPHGAGEWELHNLVSDPGETTDLRASEPEKFKELMVAWEEYVRSHGVIWGTLPAALTTVNGSDPTDDPTGWMKYKSGK